MGATVEERPIERGGIPLVQPRGKQVSASVVVVRTREQEVAARGQGQTVNISGVLVSADGDVMTAAHLVHTGDEVTVKFLNGEVMEARVIVSEPAADVALLRLELSDPGAPGVRPDSRNPPLSPPPPSRLTPPPSALYQGVSRWSLTLARSPQDPRPRARGEPSLTA